MAPEVYEELQQRTIGEIRVHHEKFPLREGLSREELRMKLGAFIGPKLFHAAMRDLEKAGKIVTDRENIRLPDHRVSLQDDQESLRREIAEWYRQAGLAPPSLREVTEKFAQHKSQIGGILNVMLKNGTLTKAEMETAAADMFKKRDRNGDGFITPDEIGKRHKK